MQTLFIIGNGFDIAHKLKTKYSDFREYLENTYPNALRNDFSYSLPEPIHLPNGEVEYDNEDNVKFILDVIDRTEGEEWNDLESSLAYLDLDEYFDTVQESVSYDEVGDINLWHSAYANEDLADNLVNPILSITGFFSEWIHSIDIDEKKINKLKKFNNLIDKNTIFMTFNYTNTIELLYKMKNVYHIHGEQGKEIFFGHGEDDAYSNLFDKYIGAERGLSEVATLLKKNTFKALTNHATLFTKTLNNLTHIYSFGFSFSKVDLIYIEEIIKNTNSKNIVWYLSDFDDEVRRNQFKTQLKKLGFDGEFDTYSL